jgi:hypothetical protein
LDPVLLVFFTVTSSGIAKPEATYRKKCGRDNTDHKLRTVITNSVQVQKIGAPLDPVKGLYLVSSTLRECSL